ncbi:MAG: PAS domain S-box protein [Cyclobacteriaceae bacterium]|nr:PAS domain S-box protein [Cyclobacteriaceae bacterium]
MNNKPDYSSFFYFNPLPSWVYDLKTFQILDVNQAALAHYGYNKTEFLNLTIKDIRPSEEIPKLISAHTDIDKREGNIFFGVFTHQKKTGELIRMEINGHKVDFLDKKCIMVVCQDVTQEEEQFRQLKESEEALRQSEARFRTIFEIASLGIAQVNPANGQILLVNSFYESITGYKVDELLKMTFVELTHPDDRAKDWEVFSKAVRGEEDYRNEKRYIKKDGTIVWVRLHLAFIRDEKGAPTRTVAICEDITERKEAEQRLQNLSDNIPGVVFQYLLLPDGLDALRSVSKGAMKIWGYSPEEVTNDIHLVWNQTKAGGDFEVVKLSIQEAIKTKTKWAAQYRSVLPNGDVQVHLGSGTPNFLPDGTILFNSIVLDITQDAKNKELLAQASQLARIGSWELDMVNEENDDMYWSPMTRDILEVDEGYNPSLTGGLEFYVEDSKQRIKKAVEELIKAGREFDEELLLITGKGREKWVRTIGKSERVNGKCLKIYGSFQDIHTSKSLENQIRVILESIGDAFIALDRNWIVTYWNKEAENLVGHKREDIIGKNIWDLYPDAMDLEFGRQYRKAMETGETVHFEDFYKNPSGLELWLEMTAYPSKDGLSIYFKDITERKQADIRLLQANERFEKVTEATNDAIWDYDVVNNHLFWGNGFYTLFGYNAEETKPSFKLLESLIHEDDRERIISQAQRFMTDPALKDWYEEYRFLKADNSFAFVIDRATFLRNNEGKVVRVIGAMNDITERKNFEYQLLELNASLKKYARELEISNEELEQFAFITSHDLQEPLRMITSFMDQLRRKYGDKLDEKANQYIHFAIDGAKRMKSIILDLLEYSKAGKFTDKPEKIDLYDLLENYQLLRRKIIIEKSVEISFDRLPVVESHKAPLTQTIHCLLDNAIHYSREGQAPKINISVFDREGFWEIEIADNGIGIDPQFHEKIFIIFQRLHNRDKYDGTGIGLSIAKKHVESWGGKIWLESKPGVGSTFHFTIPKQQNDVIMITKTSNVLY